MLLIKRVEVLRVICPMHRRCGEELRCMIFNTLYTLPHEWNPNAASEKRVHRVTMMRLAILSTTLQNKNSPLSLGAVSSIVRCLVGQLHLLIIERSLVVPITPLNDKYVHIRD